MWPGQESPLGGPPPTEASQPWDRSQPGGTEDGLLSMCGQLLWVPPCQVEGHAGQVLSPSRYRGYFERASPHPHPVRNGTWEKKLEARSLLHG